MRPIIRSVTCAVVSLATTVFGRAFQGFDSATLEAVSDSAGQWGLNIVVMDVGQADAILVLTPNGDV